MPAWLRGEARDSVAALRSLFALTSLATEARFRTGAPVAPDRLMGFYRKAQRRFGVRWNYLAAVNFIESNFNRLRNVSSAGAVGPMQFIPSTWAAYGMGGNIRDPHDAIMGAANYLRASGAPGSYSRALYRYNPSTLYVRAVLRYARRMARDRRAYYAYWSWQSFMRTREGDVQLTGPGKDR
jgi:membrane-bound lytic murein transglycosylase B